MSLDARSRISCTFKAIGIWIIIFLSSNLIGGIAGQVGGLVSAMASIQTSFTILSMLTAIILFRDEYRDLMGFRSPPIKSISRVVAISFISSLPTTYLINILASTSKQIQADIQLLIPMTLILAPIGEELLFRGLLLGHLMRCISRWPSTSLIRKAKPRHCAKPIPRAPWRCWKRLAERSSPPASNRPLGTGSWHESTGASPRCSSTLNRTALESTWRSEASGPARTSSASVK